MRMIDIALAMLLAGTPAAVAGALHASTESSGIVWFRGTFEEALAEAQRSDRLLMIEFWTNWCGWCKKFDQETHQDAGVIAELEDVVCFALDAESAEGKQLSTRFNLKAFPALFFVDKAGQTEDVLFGFQAPADFLLELQRVEQGRGTVSSLEARIAKDPSDVQAHYDLAFKKWDLGDGEGYYHHLHQIRRADPGLHTLPMREMVLRGIQEEMFGCRQRGETFDEEPLRTFLGQEKHAALLFDGWSYLAEVHGELGHHSRSSEAIALAWPHVAPEQRTAYADKSMAWFWQERSQVSKQDAEIALEISLALRKETGDAGGDGAAEAAAIARLARAYSLVRKHDKAVLLMERALELDPTNADHAATLELLRARS